MKRLKRVLFIYSLFDIGNNEAVFVIGFFLVAAVIHVLCRFL